MQRGILAVDRAQRLQHVDLLVADHVGIERGGRLHRDEREDLQHVVLHHVAHRAGAVVVVGPSLLDADGLGDRDLDELDVVPVPDRLEDGVVEAQAEQVLHRLLAQVVVDAQHLVLAELAVHRVVQRARTREVVAERLLDDHAPVADALVVVAMDDARGAQQRDGGPEQARAQRQVAHAPEFAAAGERVDLRAQLLQRHEVADVGAAIVDVARDRLERAHEVRRKGGAKLCPERVVVHLPPPDTDDLDARAEQARVREPRHRGHELAAREIAAAAEDDELREADLDRKCSSRAPYCIQDVVIVLDKRGLRASMWCVDRHRLQQRAV